MSQYSKVSSEMRSNLYTHNTLCSHSCFYGYWAVSSCSYFTSIFLGIKTSFSHLCTWGTYLNFTTLCWNNTIKSWPGGSVFNPFLLQTLFFPQKALKPPALYGHINDVSIRQTHLNWCGGFNQLNSSVPVKSISIQLADTIIKPSVLHDWLMCVFACVWERDITELCKI